MVTTRIYIWFVARKSTQKKHMHIIADKHTSNPQESVSNKHHHIEEVSINKSSCRSCAFLCFPVSACAFKCLNRSESAPRFCCFISLDCRCRDVKCSIFDIWIIESIINGWWNFLCVNIDVFYIFTSSESTIFNTCHRIRYRDGGEAAAICESTISNTCHRIRNRDGGEAAASRESLISNTCHEIFWIFK